MASDYNATWTKGKRTIHGSWSYNWASDTFHITINLNKPDPITGATSQQITTHNDHPEFNGWKLVRKETPIPCPTNPKTKTTKHKTTKHKTTKPKRKTKNPKLPKCPDPST